MKILAKIIFLILITIAIYPSYKFMQYEIAFDKYQKCMLSINNIQDVEINDCLQELK